MIGFRKIVNCGGVENVKRQLRRRTSNSKCAPCGTRELWLFGFAEIADVYSELLTFFVEVAAFEAESLSYVSHVMVVTL